MTDYRPRRENMEAPPMIGKNIQKMRTDRGLTLNVLSEKSGVSKAMLSQIESDKVNPTVATVWKIAKGLGVDLNELLSTDALPKRIFSVNPNETKSAAALEMVDHGVTIKVLSPLNMVEELEMYLLTLPVGTELPSEPHYPGTQEFLTILKGQVMVTAGNNTATLKKGDFLVYHCDVDHTIANSGSQPAEVHMVVRYTKK